MSRSIRQFALVAISVVAVLALGFAWRIAHRMPATVEELSRLEASEQAAERLGVAFAELEQVLLVRAGYQPGQGSSSADAVVTPVRLLLNELRASSEGLPVHEDVEALLRLAGTVLSTPGSRGVFPLDRAESLAALDRLAATQASLVRLRTTLSTATVVGRDVYRRAQMQARWLSAGAALTGLVLAGFVLASARRHLRTYGTVTAAGPVAGGDFQQPVPSSARPPGRP